jgi:two-component system, OmpR family, sensor histidine kinase BaeS
MRHNLWFRFLILLVGIAIVSLSSALLLRELMLKDFREYLEGEAEDRVYWVIADLEGTFDRYGEWKEDVLHENLIWALMLGFEARLRDDQGRELMSTDKALSTLSEPVRNRVAAIARGREEPPESGYLPYPLFLRGKEIGMLEVRMLKPRRELVFIESSNRFLLLSMIVVGCIAIALSLLFSRKLTKPLKTLADATQAIAAGDLRRKVAVSGSTEIQHLSDNFNRMAKALEFQESLRKNLIANVAHELRTPIGAMRSELESIRDGMIPLSRDNISSLLDETGRLTGIIEGIEQISQAQASALTLKKETFGLNQFLFNIRERLLGKAGERQATVAIECVEEISVHADPDRLTQIMLNLMSNALKAINDGGRIVLRGDRKDDEIVISVIDNGKGIPAEELALIFERFYSASEGGLGIGLSIVKELVQAHGGCIEVKSKPGKGSEFIMHLPNGLNNS